MNNLMFADDCILFYKALVEECRSISKILELYEVVSGQCLNEQKTSILFSGNTKQQVRRQILEVVGQD